MKKKSEQPDDDLRPEYDFHSLRVVARGPGRKKPGEIRTMGMSSELSKSLAAKVDLMNFHGTVESNEVLQILAEELPQAHVFKQRLPPPGVPMAGIGDWQIVLDAGESIVTIGLALWAVWEKFRNRAQRKTHGPEPGVSIELGNANSEFVLIRIGPESGDRKVFIEQFTEKAELLAKADGEEEGGLRAKLERSGSWIKVR